MASDVGGETITDALWGHISSAAFGRGSFARRISGPGWLSGRRLSSGGADSSRIMACAPVGSDAARFTFFAVEFTNETLLNFCREDAGIEIEGSLDDEIAALGVSFAAALLHEPITPPVIAADGATCSLGLTFPLGQGMNVECALTLVVVEAGSTVPAKVYEDLIVAVPPGTCHSGRTEQRSDSKDVPPSKKSRS